MSFRVVTVMLFIHVPILSDRRVSQKDNIFNGIRIRILWYGAFLRGPLTYSKTLGSQDGRSKCSKSVPIPWMLFGHNDYLYISLKAWSRLSWSSVTIISDFSNTYSYTKYIYDRPNAKRQSIPIRVITCFLFSPHAACSIPRRKENMKNTAASLIYMAWQTCQCYSLWK